MPYQSALSEGNTPRWTRTHGLALCTVIVAAMYALVAGTLTLIGWAFKIPRLTDWSNDGISMFANTAACAIMAGAALLLLVGDSPGIRRILARVMAGLTAVVGGLTLLEHLSGLDFRIDTLLFDGSWGQRAATAPMRMGLPASSSFLVLGAAMLLATYGRRARRIANALAIVPVAIASLSLTGYWFGADQLFGVARLTGIAWQTSTILAALGLGLIAAMPEHGLVAVLRREDAGGMLVRRLLLPIIALPLLLGWLRLIGEERGLYDTAFGVSLFVLAMIAMLVILLLWTANGISRQAEIALAAEQAERQSQARLERELKERAEQLVHADRRKDEYLATLAHELRNPLAPIRNALEIMKHAPNEDVLDATRQMIERQVSHLVRLVDDLLDVSRITRDKLKLRKERVELASVVDQAVEICRPLLDGYRHELVRSLPSEPIYLRADPVRLTQIFGNLLNNACKFTEPEGRIEIAAQREGSDVVIKVKDSGLGLAPEALPKVFELFVQGDPSTDQSHGGLGIGLSLVKRLVEAHGGAVEAHSDGPKRGSEFIVRLPVLMEPPETKASPRAESLLSAAGKAPTTARSILVVDDNRDAASSLAMLLKLIGYHVAVAYDGLEAVEAAEQIKPDVVLLDIGLPKMNGYDVCRTIRQQPWADNMAVIALTGWGQEEDRRKSREAGFDGHLVKPATKDAVTELLNSLVLEPTGK